jgi:hypothetical protein
MDNWRQEMIKDSEKRLLHVIENAVDGHKLRLKVIDVLIEPAFVFGDTHIYVSTKSHKQVHAIAKALGEKFTKHVADDGLNYEGKFVTVYGEIQPPGCKLIKKEVLVPARMKTVFELKCPEEAENERVEKTEPRVT